MIDTNSVKIELLVLDVDGTLTDGSVYYGDGNIEIKGFSTKDGAILKPLPRLGIEVVFLTGRKSEAVTRRATDLGAMAIQNISDKAAKLREIIVTRGVSWEQTAYIGDDLNDYTAMKLCGYKACPADAAEEVKAICDYVSLYNGGYGAVRDICELMLKKMDIWAELLSVYGV